MGVARKPSKRLPRVPRYREKEDLTTAEVALCDQVATVLMDQHQRRKKASVETPGGSNRRDAIPSKIEAGT